MLYLMTVLTFLAAIMFYILSPHEDKLNLDTYQAEPMIQALVGQHQAAKDYLSQWFGAHLSGASGNYFNLQPNGLTEFLPKGIVYMMCANNAGTAGADYPPVQNDSSSENGECFISRVICTDASENLTACNTDVAANNSYVVTYGGWAGTLANPQRPSWWPKDGESRARRNERWRRAIAQRTHGSLNCGTLYEYPVTKNYNNWCLDNGQVSQEERFGNEATRCAKPIPAGVIEGLNAPGAELKDKFTYLYDMFFCMSPLVQGPAHYYPSDLTHYFDGLDNWNKHAPSSNTATHQLGNQKLWYDLIESVDNEANPTTGVAGVYDGSKFNSLDQTATDVFANPATPYLSLQGSKLDFNIAPGTSDFTISEVVAFENVDKNFNLMVFEKSVLQFIKVDYMGSDHQIVLTIQNGANTYYKFKADVTLQANQVFTLTLTRSGDEIALYMGGHETLSANERKMFSGRLFSSVREAVKEILTNTPTNTKLYIKNLNNDKALRLYAVRAFGRGLGTSDVYKMYKEDLKRYGSGFATHYDTVFESDIDWPETEYENVYVKEETRGN